MNHSNLATTYNFRGKEYLINLYSDKKNAGNIEIKVTEKKTFEEWQGSYDASYVENLTQKTGNYKRFDTFISMLKSSLLGTSQCVTLDLLTFEDLEMLRNRVSPSRGFGVTHPSHMMTSQTNNRRYLIVTYTVEFDRIHYPLALEYSGLPDPRILQETIRRLEKQVSELELQLHSSDWKDITDQIEVLQKKVVDVTTENIFLKEQLQTLNNLYKRKQSCKDINMLTQSIQGLENKLKIKTDSIVKLKKENGHLLLKLDEAEKIEKRLRIELKTNRFEPQFTNKGQRTPSKRLSPSPNRNRNLDNCAEKPFSRCILRERKVCSARSSFDMCRSSSEDSVYSANRLMGAKGYQIKLPRASSPSLSELSHNSEISQCACKNCMQSQFNFREGNTSIKKRRSKAIGKGALIKRIQSLEKLINGIT